MVIYGSLHPMFKTKHFKHFFWLLYIGHHQGTTQTIDYRLMTIGFDPMEDHAYCA